MRWKVKEYLEQNGKTPYALWKASTLSRNTVYAIAQNDKKGVEFDTLAKLIAGLEELIGKPVELADILEVSHG